MTANLKRIHRILIATVLLVAMLLLLLVFGVGTSGAVLQFLQWMHEADSATQLMSIPVMAAVVVLVLPGVLFTLGAGFMFGVIKGTIFVVVGTSVGATVAFLAARYLFNERVNRNFLSHPRLHKINQQCVGEGWKMVMATRLLPFFPFKLSNYYFGLTQFTVKAFVLGTVIGIISFSLHSVYLGSIAANLTSLGVINVRLPVAWSFYAGGFLLALAALIYFRRFARRALAANLGQGEPRPGQVHPETGHPPPIKQERIKTCRG